VKNRLISCLIVLAIVLLQCGMCVFASDDLSSNVEITGDKMRIYGNLTSREENEVLLRVMRVDDEADLDAKTIYIEQKSTETNGYYEFEVTLEDVAPEPLPTTLDGFEPTKYVYSVGILDGTSDYDSDEIEFYGENYQNLVMKLINEAKSALKSGSTSELDAAEDIKNVLDEAYSCLYLGAQGYEDYLENATDIETVMKYVANQPKVEALSDLKNQLNEAAMVTMLKDKKNDAEGVKQMIENEEYRKALGINDTTALITYEDFYNLCGDKMALGYAQSDFNSIEESTEAFEFAVISESLKECVTASQVRTLLTTNQGILKIDVDSYELTNSELLKLSGLVLEAELGEIKEKILDIIADRKSNNSSNNGGGSGGNKGGGSGGSMIGFVPPSAVEKPTTVPEKTSVDFKDIAGFEWAEESIKELAEKAIVNGKGENRFEPSANVTREEFLKMLVLALEITTDKNAISAFADVKASEWYAEYVNTAFSCKIVNGISADRFGIGESIKREDAAIIAYRALDSLALLNQEVEFECEFTDIDSISEYAYSAIAFMENNQLINGYEDGSFKAQGTITRAEAAVLIKRIIDFSNRVL